jgi:hypothetical protein
MLKQLLRDGIARHDVHSGEYLDSHNVKRTQSLHMTYI